MFPPASAQDSAFSAFLLLDSEGRIQAAGGSEGVANQEGQTLASSGWFDYSPSALAALEAALIRATRQETQRFHSAVQLEGQDRTLVEVAVTRLSPDTTALTLNETRPEPDALEALQESGRTLANLLSCWPGYAFRCLNDESYTTVYASEGCREITGHSPESLISGEFDYTSIMHPDDRDEVWRQTQEALDRHERYQVQYRIQTPAGLKWMWEQGQGVWSEAGELRFIEGFVTDITELRIAQESLRRASRIQAVGQLAGGVAHDFNNLLQGVLGSAELLRLRVPEQSALLEDMLQLCRHGASLTTQLLTFSNGSVVERKRHDLGALLERLRPTLRRLIRTDIELHVSTEPGEIEVDRGQLEQIVINLCLNARDAMPTGGALRLEARCAAETVTLSVQDTGRGMSSKTLAGIFEPFFTTRADGTGIGLYVVKRIVDELQAKIRVSSTVDVGTTFWIEFPKLSPLVIPQQTSTDGGEASPSTKTHVLVIDDDALVRSVTAALLEALGVQVATEAAPDSALAHLRDHEVDVLLTDVMMPELNGLELASQARAIRPDLRVVFTSGYAPESRVQQSVNSGEAFFLPKPFNLSTLRALLLKVQPSR